MMQGVVRRRSENEERRSSFFKSSHDVTNSSSRTVAEVFETFFKKRQYTIEEQTSADNGFMVANDEACSEESTPTVDENENADGDIAIGTSEGSLVVIDDPSSSKALVIRDPRDLGDAFTQWVDSIDYLFKSEATKHVVQSTVYLAGTTGKVCINAALLPVTFPMHVAGCAGGALVKVSNHVVSRAGAIVGAAVDCVSESLDTEDPNPQDSHPSQSGGLLDTVLFPGKFLLCSTGKVVGQVGAAVSQIAMPKKGDPSMQSPKAQTNKQESHYRGMLSKLDSDDEFLQRLRLDYVAPHERSKSQEDVSSPYKIAATKLNSTMLLRIKDLGITDVGASDEDADVLTYIDLENAEDLVMMIETGMLSRVLDSMVLHGFALLKDHPTVRVPLAAESSNVSASMEIIWQVEGSTGKVLKRMADVTSIERLDMLRNETLVWSGRASSCSTPIFLARGVIPMRPREILNLLWDNSRTPEYNNFCLGRKTQANLGCSHIDCNNKSDDDVRGSKIITSETRVPFTGLSVTMSCLMHACSFAGGYVIVTRSVHEGQSGRSNKEKVMKESKNEILWGINVIRRVPSHPHLTDLTSLSQVKSGMVPKFLVKKIGLMGVEDFFKSIRKASANIQ